MVSALESENNLPRGLQCLHTSLTVKDSLPAAKAQEVIAGSYLQPSTEKFFMDSHAVAAASADHLMLSDELSEMKSNSLHDLPQLAAYLQTRHMPGAPSTCNGLMEE